MEEPIKSREKHYSLVLYILNYAIIVVSTAFYIIYIIIVLVWYRSFLLLLF